MQSFEKYHPIMSVHYTMDWLTTFKIKDIFQLRAAKLLPNPDANLIKKLQTLPATLTVRCGW